MCRYQPCQCAHFVVGQSALVLAEFDRVLHPPARAGDMGQVLGSGAGGPPGQVVVELVGVVRPAAGDHPAAGPGLSASGTSAYQVAQIARALGMKVVAYAREMSDERAALLGVEFRPLAEVLPLSDFVSLHTPLTPETAGLIGAAEFAVMKPGAFLVNTARAGLVDQGALLEALTDGRLAGAALDDLHPTRSDIISLDNVVATPHIGFFTDSALGKKGDICVSNVEAFLRGRSQNVVAGPE